MKLTVYGARGSIPCSNENVVRYGGETTCAFVRASDGSTIVLDLGTGARELGNELVASKEASRELHVLLTHAHWDHLMGFPFFAPLYSSEFRLVFHGWCDAQMSVQALLEDAMKPPFFPVDMNNVEAELDFNRAPEQEFAIGSIYVRRFPLCHPNGGCAFMLEEDGKRICFFPDNELTFDHPGGRSYVETVEFCRNSDVLIHDAEYYREEYEKQTRGFGHTVFEDTVRLGLDAGVKRLILWHHKPERTDVEIDDMIEEARRRIAEAGSDMVCEAAYRGLVIEP